MASLLDLYAPPPQIPALSLGGLQQREGDALDDSAYSLANLYRKFSTRTVPDFVRGQASRNTAYSGGTRVGVDRLREDVNLSAADLQRALARELRNIRQARPFAAMGQDSPF